MTRTRLALAAAVVGLLAVSAGCAGLLGSEVPDKALEKDPPHPYKWNASADVYIEVNDGTYQAVFDLSATNTSKLVLYERGLSSDRPEWVRSVRYRYPNGTTVTGTHPAVSVNLKGSRRVIEVQNASGKLAFTSDSDIKQFGIRTPAEGSYEVVLPPNRRTSSFLFGQVSPRGYSTRVDDRSRLHITWDEVSSPIYIRYYLIRDLLLFRGMALLLALVGAGVVVYYTRIIRKLKERREEMGLDVEEEDDEFGRDPPPGMG